MVDDGSTDGTREYLANLSGQVPAAERRDPSVAADGLVILFNERNFGKGWSLRRGFEVATGEVVIVQDADLEYDPHDYPALLAPIERGIADVVYGSRFLGGPHRVLYYWHYVGNRLLTTLSNMLTNVNLTDMETCYKAFRSEVLQSLVLTERGFNIEPEITAKVARGNWRIYEVPISYHGRTYAEGKKIRWVDGVRAICAILRHNLLPQRRGNRR